MESLIYNLILLIIAIVVIVILLKFVFAVILVGGIYTDIAFAPEIPQIQELKHLYH